MKAKIFSVNFRDRKGKYLEREVEIKPSASEKIEIEITPKMLKELKTTVEANKEEIAKIKEVLQEIKKTLGIG
ncbi:MAG: hypothetical protein B6U76_09710 [Desulfurococcales archaeon ex4484_217_2]|nr:MAG: hypothetical protein B6U76_09710 [Desulfurococcales archaeon ex4484_217_2]